MQLLITACSTIPSGELDRVERAVLYKVKAGVLQQSDRWALTGRLAINDGKDGGSGRLNWKKQGLSSSMNFRGTLGRGAWQLNASEDDAVLEWADGEIHRADSVDELIAQQLGWTIPVAALAWWVRGLIAPGDWDMRELDEHGNLEKLSQSGWSIEYGRYRDTGSVSMPVKLTARRRAYTVKFAIKEWEIETGKGWYE